MSIYDGLDDKKTLEKLDRLPGMHASAGEFIVDVQNLGAKQYKGAPECFQLQATIVEAKNSESPDLKPGADAVFTVWKDDDYDHHVKPMALIIGAVLNERVTKLSKELAQRLETSKNVAGTRIRIKNTRVFKTDKNGQPVMSKKDPTKQVEYIESEFSFIAPSPATTEALKALETAKAPAAKK